MEDILLVANQVKEQTSTVFPLIVDYAYKISMVVIAIVNAFLLFYRNKKNDKKEAANKEKDRKISLLKTLILDYNLQYFYEIFEQIEKELIILKQKDCDKTQLEPKLQSLFNQLFEKFINFISAIDANLYDELLNHCDHCRDTLIENIADEGVNLWAENQYNGKIKSVVEGDKKKMISLLFGYKG